MGNLFMTYRKRETEEISFEDLSDILEGRSRVVALTGAGVSAESGVPTFRDPGDGIWRKFDPASYGTIWGFWRDPAKIWQLLKEIYAKYDLAPSGGHVALARLERLGLLSTIITQNVDGFHQAAGNSNVIEYHGSFTYAKCYSCGNTLHLTEQVLQDTVFRRPLPPTCHCGGIYKPDCVLFGESINAQVNQAAQESIKQADLLLVIGTSATVSPACDLVKKANRSNITVVEINTQPTAITNELSDYICIGKSSQLNITCDKLQQATTGTGNQHLPLPSFTQ